MNEIKGKRREKERKWKEKGGKNKKRNKCQKAKQSWKKLGL
jgi:hypothetical protein